MTSKKLFLFRQNNSGGYFTVDDTVDVNVVIEAESADQANEIATKHLGIYFNGVDAGFDCECCGDRWYPVEESDETDKVRISLLLGAHTAQDLKDNTPQDTRFYYCVGDSVIAHHLCSSTDGKLDSEEKN